MARYTYNNSDLNLDPILSLNNIIKYDDNISLIGIHDTNICILLLLTKTNNGYSRKIIRQGLSFTGFIYNKRIVTFKEHYLTIEEEENKKIYFVKECENLSSLIFKEEAPEILVLENNEYKSEFNILTEKSIGNLTFSKVDQYPPNLLSRIGTGGTALFKHIIRGRPEASEQVYNKRLELCVTCPWLGKDWVCNGCGCDVRVKAKWADQHCPICSICGKKETEHQSSCEKFTPFWGDAKVPIKQKCGGCGS